MTKHAHACHCEEFLLGILTKQSEATHTLKSITLRLGNGLFSNHAFCVTSHTNMEKWIVRNCVTPSGNIPFRKWLTGLKDIKARAVIRERLNRLRLGNIGGCKIAGEGIRELRIHYGLDTACILQSQERPQLSCYVEG